MNTKLIALLLFAVTGTAVTFYPEPGTFLGGTKDTPSPMPLTPLTAADTPRVEVVFVLDTTGSMGGLIQTAREKIWSIATTMASAQPAPEIHMGLVAYRDRGDDYVTRVTDLSTDLDSVYATLMDYRAQGGGDGPESVNAALADAVDNVSWSQDPDAYRVIFLVGDAPPHMDYQDEDHYPEILARAQARGIVVNTIRCGDDPTTEQTWLQIASLARGDYFTVAQTGGGIHITTPYDAQLASLSAALDRTRVFYGDGEARAKAESKVAATAKLHADADEASRARRAAFNASASGAANLFGGLDLVSAVADGRVRLEDVKDEALPPVMQSMSPEERETHVAHQADERARLQEEIRALTGKRDDYLAEQAESRGDLSDTLDYQLYESVRAQTAEKGLIYEAPAPKL